MKKLWIVLVFLLLIGCGAKDACPSCSYEVDFSKDVFCSNCGRTFTNIKPDGYEEPQNNTHLGTWEIRLPTDYGDNFYDVAVNVLLTLRADGTYDWEFGGLVLNKNSVAYQELLEVYGSEKEAEKDLRGECLEIAEELASIKYHLVQSKNDMEQEFEDVYYDQTSDMLWFNYDGLVLAGTRK